MHLVRFFLVGMLCLVAVGISSTSATAQESRVAIVAVGPDGELTGRLQETLETAIDDEKRTVLGAVAIGQILQTPSAPPQVNVSARRRWLRLMERATQAYFEDRMSDAQVDLSQADSLQQTGVVPVEDRVRLRLSEAAVYQAINNTSRARQSIHEALTLQPELRVSLNDYPPSFVKIVDDVRRDLRFIDVTVEGLPRGSRLEVDDRSSDSRFRVPAGRHVILATGEGLRTQRLVIDIDEPKALRIYPAVALSDSIAARLQRAATSGDDVNDDDLQLMSSMIDKLQVDTLVLGAVIPAADSSVLVYKRGAKIQSFRVGSTRPADLRTVATQAADALVTRTSILPPEAPWEVTSGAALRLAYNQRNVTGDGDAGFSSGFFGGGANASLEARKALLLARADVSITTYEITPSKFNLPGGGQSRAGGGTSIFARAGVGGTFETGSVQLAATLNPWIDSLSVEDLQGTSGPLGLLVGHFGFGLDFGAHASVPAGPVVVGGDVFLTVLGVYKENPTGVTGDNPSVALALSPRVTVAQASTSSTWRWYLTAERRALALRFEGSAIAPVAPPVDDAKVSESAVVVSFGFQRAF